MVSALSLLLCDHVYQDPVSRKLTLLGVANTIRAARFPTPAREFTVWVLLAGDPGESGVLNFAISEEESGSVCLEDQVPFHFSDRPTLPVRAVLSEFSFPKAARYRFTFSLGRQSIAERVIPVQQFLR